MASISEYEEYPSPLNAALPIGAHFDDAWKTVFLPTLLEYIGTQRDPWRWPDSFAIPTLQAIWSAVYGSKLPYTVVARDSVHSLVS